MSNTRTLTEKTLSNRHVVDVLNEQTGNLTQRHFDKTGPYRKVYGMLSQVARRAIQCALSKPVAKPDLTRRNWRRIFANAVVKVMTNAGFKSDVEGYIKQFQQTLPKVIGSRAKIGWSYFKIATYAGQCATMLLHGLDPDLLTASDEEIVEEQMHLIDIAEQHNVPTIVVHN